jgi:diguanylate cyclase (GGDEF)-like protein
MTAIAAIAYPSTPAQAPDAEASVKPRILVVDDVPDNREVLVRRLVRRGFETEEAAGGREALDKLVRQRFDLVLLDIMMPDMSGNEVLRTLRQTHSELELPVIMVTAKSQSEDVVESLDLGANDYVTKPVDFTVALARINGQLARKRAMDAERESREHEAAELQQAVAQASDQRRHTEEQLEYLAYHDQLTGLMNRAAFRDMLQTVLARPEGIETALLYIDLDRFKVINDSFGHEVGDGLIAAVGQRLAGVAPERIKFGRLGGDEFGAIIEDASAAGALSDAQSMVEALQEPIAVGGQPFHVAASCGIALASACGRDALVMLKAADLAMYRAKAVGTGAAVLFEPGMLEEQRTRQQLENDLRGAIQAGQFSVFYQPLIDLATGRVACFEALLRWNHPVRGPIPPDSFIPIAEESGLIMGLGEWALRQACAEAVGWPEDISVAVNLSPLQFRSPALLATVVHALASSGLPPSRLELEITETALLQAETRNRDTLKSLRGLGVRVCIDDFGTGYSTMGFLQNFEVDKIKIDRRFVQDLGEEASAAAIVKAITDLGVTLGASITAEGVETRAQLTTVAESGCTHVQGFVFSRPLSSAAAREFLRASAGMSYIADPEEGASS